MKVVLLVKKKSVIGWYAKNNYTQQYGYYRSDKRIKYSLKIQSLPGLTVSTWNKLWIVNWHLTDAIKKKRAEQLIWAHWGDRQQERIRGRGQFGVVGIYLKAHFWLEVKEILGRAWGIGNVQIIQNMLRAVQNEAYSMTKVRIIVVYSVFHLVAVDCWEQLS